MLNCLKMPKNVDVALYLQCCYIKVSETEDFGLKSKLYTFKGSKSNHSFNMNFCHLDHGINSLFP